MILEAIYEGSFDILRMGFVPNEVVTAAKRHYCEILLKAINILNNSS